ncbi:GNAT family N-acetyltransferase [soil metagenome]
MAPPVEIRRFDAKDLDACYAISLATGLAGGDASSLYRDPRLMGHIYVAPYAALAPELALVVEDPCGVAGFVVGTDDTAAWEARLALEWWPSLRKQYADPSDVPAASHTADQRRASMIHHPACTPAAVVARYPGHLHMNLLPRLQRHGIGSGLLATWLDAAAGRNATAFHVGVNRGNTGAIGFWRRQGFEPFAPGGRPEERALWMGRDKP